jgi:hypothetical protein
MKRVMWWVFKSIADVRNWCATGRRAMLESLGLPTGGLAFSREDLSRPWQVPTTSVLHGASTRWPLPDRDATSPRETCPRTHWTRSPTSNYQIRYCRGLGANRTKEVKSFLILLLLPLHHPASTAVSVSFSFSQFSFIHLHHSPAHSCSPTSYSITLIFRHAPSFHSARPFNLLLILFQPSPSNLPLNSSPCTS